VSSKSEFHPHPVVRRRRMAGTLMVLALAATALVMWPVGPLPGRSWGFIALGLWVGAWIWLAVTTCRECGKPFFLEASRLQSTAGPLRIVRGLAARSDGSGLTGVRARAPEVSPEDR